MADLASTRLLDSYLTASKPNLNDRDLIEALFERSSQKELVSLRSYITRQAESGKYHPNRAHQLLDRLKQIQNNKTQLLSENRKLNVSSIAKTPQRVGHHRHQNSATLSTTGYITPPVEMSFAMDKMKLVVTQSISTALSLAILRSLDFGFKRIQEDSIRKRISYEWEEVMASGKLKTNQLLSNKTKGRIISAMYKYRPALSIKSAFFRWKIKSDPILVKHVADRFALFARINMTVALWRMKSVLTSKTKEEALRRKLIKQIKAAKIITAIVNKILFSNQVLGFSKIKDHLHYVRMVKKALDNIKNNFKVAKQKAFEKWLHVAATERYEEQRIRVFRVLGNSIDLVRKAFDLWRNDTVCYRLSKEKQRCLGGPKLARILNSKLKEALKDAFEALKEEAVQAKEEREESVRRLGNLQKGVRILDISRKNIEKRLIAYSLMVMKDWTSEEKYSKMKVLLKLVQRNEIWLRDVLRRWKTVCDLRNIIAMNNLTQRFFTLSNKVLYSRTSLIFKLEREKKTKTALK